MVHTHLYSRSKKISIISNANYRREVKNTSIIMDYCLLQFDALKLFLGVHLHGVSIPNFNLFNVNLQIFHRNRLVHFSNCLKTNFHNISYFSSRVFKHRNYR